MQDEAGCRHQIEMLSDEVWDALPEDPAPLRIVKVPIPPSPLLFRLSLNFTTLQCQLKTYSAVEIEKQLACRQNGLHICTLPCARQADCKSAASIEACGQ